MTRIFLAYKDLGRDNIMAISYDDKAAKFSIEIDEAVIYSKDCYEVTGETVSFEFRFPCNNKRFNDYLLKEDSQKASNMLNSYCGLFKPFKSSSQGTHGTFDFRGVAGGSSTTPFPYDLIEEHKHPAVKTFLEEFNKIRKINAADTIIYHPVNEVCWFHSFDDIVAAKKQDALLCEIRYR